MATAPQYVTTQNNGEFNVVLTTANTAKDGTGTVALLFTAGPNGSRLKKIIAKPIGTNVQTVLRLFLNNGSTPTSASNNMFFYDITLLASTASETAAQPGFDIPIELDIQAGYRVYAAIGTTVAAGLAVSAHGGDY